MHSNFSDFEHKVGITFADKKLLRQAFLHRSYLNEHPDEESGHNERLEFLGDAVLELVVTDFLYKAYPDKTEGDLTVYRAAMVNTNSISDAAHALGMNDYLLLSKGEAKDTGKSRSYILANTFEAFIGAVYLDRGYDAAQAFIARMLFDKVDAIVKGRLWQDDKSRFQEKAQEVRGITPAYRVLKEDGPDHDKTFTVGVFLNEEQFGEGNGHSKQDAEQHAAHDALAKTGWK